MDPYLDRGGDSASEHDAVVKKRWGESLRWRGDLFVWSEGGIKQT